MTFKLFCEQNVNGLDWCFKPVVYLSHHSSLNIINMKFLITELRTGMVSDGSNYWESPEIIPSETVVMKNSPVGAVYAPFAFYDSPFYGLSPIHNFDIDKFREEQAFVESFVLPEFTPDTFANRITRSVYTYEMWLKTRPKLQYFDWDTDKREWNRTHKKIFIIPAWEI